MERKIRKILGYKVMAVVGLSKKPGKPSHYVPKYMKEHGYRIIPVNPTADEILGEKCYPSLDDVPDKIEVVNLFRPSNDVLPIVESALRKKVKAIWMQEGIVNHEAAELAEKKGVLVVMDRCMMKEHRALFG